MKSVLFLILPVIMCFPYMVSGSEKLLEDGWKFHRGEIENAQEKGYDDSRWQKVDVPHDWAIYGPFDRENDLQEVAVTQNFETKATVKTGRTGGLPYVGVGWYRKQLDLSRISPDKQRVILYFDGVMSEANVYVNGKHAIFWPYGYNAFYVDITDYVTPDNKNILAVRAENKPYSSRWYSGAGIYRNVKLIIKDNVHIPVWGVHITTPDVNATSATVEVKTSIKNQAGNIRIQHKIIDSKGIVVAQSDDISNISSDKIVNKKLNIVNPLLWSPEEPNLYRLECTLSVEGRDVDKYTCAFGVRTIEVVPEKGFYLNGKNRKFQGVCLHHDLGALGAAVNRAAIKRQLAMLKDMGADAIRTSHNMPASELVELCDSLGFMLMIEPFDEWDVAKCENGYHRFFGQWAEKDMVNMLHHFRNNPSVVMWSIGNEVPTQCSEEGANVARFLQNIVHREDPTRPVTCGMDQVSCVLKNGFAAVLDVPGLNYRTMRYNEAYTTLPQKIVLGTETASTVSSRGVYKFPVVQKGGATYHDHQCSSYDVEYCPWSNIPDEDFALADDYDWTMGQFVWTGFDYLGEPSPYDTDAWPNHSSMFGIIDLASIPKDRYYLYRSLWNKKENTLHVLPHWTWPGREGENTPVFVYTNYPSAELFVNGKSYGCRSKSKESLLHRYRLMWTDVPYQPGEIKVVAYNIQGKKTEEKMICTAGMPHHLELIADRTHLTADGRDLAYITVRVVDKDGNLCPTDSSLVNFTIKGAGTYRAAANGDATSLDRFHYPKMYAFSGQLVAIVQTKKIPGKIIFEARAKGLKKGVIKLLAK